MRTHDYSSARLEVGQHFFSDAVTFVFVLRWRNLVDDNLLCGPICDEILRQHCLAQWQNDLWRR